MSILGNGGPTEEEIMEMRKEEQINQEERQMAQGLAQGAGSTMNEFAESGYWSIIRDADIECGIDEVDDHLSDFLSVETSGQLSTGNITYSDWESFCWRIEQELWVTKNEFMDSDCNLDSLDMATMGYEDRAELTDEKSRKLRHVQMPIKMMLSLSVESRGLDSGTQIHAVTKTEADDNDESGGGFLSASKRYLSG